MRVEAVQWAENDNDLDALRALPRFQAIMERARMRVAEDG